VRVSLFIAVVQSVIFLGHWFFYFTLVRFLSVTTPGRLLALRILIGLFSITLIPVSLLVSRHSELWARFLYTLTVSWIGFVYLFMLSSAAAWLFYGFAKGIHVTLDRMVLMKVLMGIAAAACLYGLINAATLRVTRITLRVDGLPAQWKGKTAVWVSDIHLGPVRNVGYSRRIVDRIRDLRPDIVFIGGDLFDGQPVDVDRLIQPFSTVSAPYGVYFITGNHEEFGDPTPYLRAVRRAGVRVLDNEMVLLDGLQIIGVDYRATRDKDRFEAILQGMGIERTRPSILLKHVPLNLDVAEKGGISVQLSGHTHRGQVFLFRFITSRVYHGYDYGLRRHGALQVHTSSGAGTWGPPMRIDTIPEIVSITFM
jgi:uncharacterized protein